MAVLAQGPAVVRVAAAPALADAAGAVRAPAQVLAAVAVLVEVRVLVVAVLAEACLSASLCWDRCSVLALWPAMSWPARAEKARGKRRTGLPGRLLVAALAVLAAWRPALLLELC